MGVQAALLCLFSLFAYAHAAYVNYNSVQLVGGGVLDRGGMFSPAEAPASGWPGNGSAFISIDLVFDLDMDGVELMPEVAVGRADVFWQVFGDKPDDSDVFGSFCCGVEQIEAGICNTPGRMVRKENADVSPSLYSYFEATRQGEGKARLTATYSLPESDGTGVYYVGVASCGGAANTSGHAQWMNPYGMLPAGLFGSLPFYTVMSLAYAGFVLVWLVLVVIHRADVVRLQWFILAVAVAGVVEMVMWRVDYNEYNNSGQYSVALSLMCVILSGITRSVSRALAIVVSTGYGVVGLELKGKLWKILLVSILYFIFSSFLDAESSYQLVQSSEESLRDYFILPVTVIDSLIITWIFSSVLHHMEELKKQRQLLKAGVFRSFLSILLAGAVLSVLWLLFEGIVTEKGYAQEYWKLLWAFDAFWHILAFLLLCGIAALWPPSKNIRRYAYSREIELEEAYANHSFAVTSGDSEEDDEEMFSAGATVDGSSTGGGGRGSAARSGGGGSTSAQNGGRGRGRKEEKGGAKGKGQVQSAFLISDSDSDGEGEARF
eukprot:CAMPEP_0113872370 /NCGR_PEP_ID=MMETSP0780_2-20120614/3169_1 /TAXON_ID=652834 /ORGANISM="Palpitomonas bilix" /LENGTH=547 /DNA_ID=CAMNT_0000857881 /DNA_START=225 /DNA_END=1868 /DNA_ORIENTATION=- /assembly_acc=CAM_ASM_000599